MSQELNNLFRSDPFRFARANVLFPGDSRGVENLENGADNPMLRSYAPIHTGDTLFQLKGGSRIWSGDLNRKGTQILLTRKMGRVDPPCMAMYYLPWSANRIMRTVLRKTRNQALRGIKDPIAANPPNPGALPVQDTNDPDVFFTANVNGCMVVVEGSREEPVVYHCNAIGVAGSVANASIIDRDAVLTQQRLDAKVNSMTTRVNTMALAEPKPGKGMVQTPTPRKKTIQSDYMILGGGGRIGVGYEESWHRIRASIARSVGIQKQTDKRIRIKNSVGTVFGVRSGGGLWTFYFQKLVNYEVWKDVGKVFSKWEKDPADLWYVVDCREFWPDGAGHAI